MTTIPAASSTSTTAGAKAHARAQEAEAAVSGAPDAVVPAESWAGQIAADKSDVVWAETVAGGSYAHRVLAAGTSVRLADIAGDACASVLLYNADAPWERLNVADTAKVQWQVYTAPGQLLLSDQGRVLASVVDDTSGHHDILYGTSAEARNVERYGDGAPEGASPAGRELFAVAAAKNGLGRRDIAPSMSFFQGVTIDAEGSPTFTGSSGPGGSITLRTEMPVIMLVANAAHPIDPREEYIASPLEIVAWRDRRTDPSDPRWSATPEGRRAFENTADYLKGRGIA